jgi:hypothetical protein
MKAEHLVVLAGEKGIKERFGKPYRVIDLRPGVERDASLSWKMKMPPRFSSRCAVWSVAKALKVCSITLIITSVSKRSV